MRLSKCACGCICVYGGRLGTYEVVRVYEVCAYGVVRVCKGLCVCYGVMLVCMKLCERL